MPPSSQTTSSNLSVPLAIVAAGAMIALAVYFSGSGGNGDLVGQGGGDFKAQVEPVSSADHILGNSNAEIVVVEYSDLECPFCKVFHTTMHRIVDEYGGKVAWVYRHYPIEQLHSKAIKEAEASECAYEQGGNAMFWRYIDQVFAITEANNTLDTAELPRIAGKLGLDVASFNECLSSGKYTAQIKKDIEEAIKAGARGTPYSIIIKGKQQIPINGAEPFESVKAKIDSLL